MQRVQAGAPDEEPMEAGQLAKVCCGLELLEVVLVRPRAHDDGVQAHPIEPHTFIVNAARSLNSYGTGRYTRRAIRAATRAGGGSRPPPSG